MESSKKKEVDFWIFMFGIFTVPFLSFRYKSITISDFLFGISYLLTRLTHATKLNFTFPRELKVATFFIILGGLLASINSSYINESLIILFKFIFIVYCILWMLIIHLTNEDKIRLLFIFWICGVIVFDLVAVFQRQSIVNSYGMGSLYRTEGLSQHYTDAGGITSIATCVIIVFALKGANSILVIPCLLLTTYALIISGSVTGYIAVSLAIVWIILSKFNASRLQKVGILTFVLFLYYVLKVFHIYDVTSRVRNASSGRYDTFDSRLINVLSAINGIFESSRSFLFGHGLDSYSGLVDSGTGYPLAVHNILVQAFFQGGFLFFLGYSSFWVIFFKYATILEKNNLGVYKPIIITALVFGSANPIMYSRYLWMPGLIVAALYARNHQKLRRQI